jgi:XTP/dITP diphosphohydrolase
MRGVENRRARFVCAIAICGLPKDVASELKWIDGCVVATGFLTGYIGQAPRGVHGFGYDPIFEINDGRSVAELSAVEKHGMSHRGEAARQVSALIAELFSTHS